MNARLRPVVVLAAENTTKPDCWVVVYGERLSVTSSIKFTLVMSWLCLLMPGRSRPRRLT